MKQNSQSGNKISEINRNNQIFLIVQFLLVTEEKLSSHIYFFLFMFCSLVPKIKYWVFVFQTVCQSVKSVISTWSAEIQYIYIEYDAKTFKLFRFSSSEFRRSDIESITELKHVLFSAPAAKNPP